MPELFQQGGPLVIPLLLILTATLAVVIERLWFIWQENKNRDLQGLEKFLDLTTQKKFDEAIQTFQQSGDFILRVLTQALINAKTYPARPFGDQLKHVAQEELKRQSAGIVFLDTVITLAPLLGLLGTVTGLIEAFRSGFSTNGMPAGVSQALIVTALGLAVAALALIPFNYLKAKFEEKRVELEDAATRLERLFDELSPK